MSELISSSGRAMQWRPVFRLGVLAFALGALAPHVAHAADISPTEKAQVEAFSKQGVRAYREGRYGEAIGYFRRAYTIFPEPKLLFNLGRCHQKAGEFDEAIDHFAQVVADATTPPALKARAETELKVLRAARKMSEAKAAPAPKSQPSVAPKVQIRPVVTPTATPRVRITRIQPPIVTAPEPATAGEDGHRGATWALVGIGSATLIAGGVFYALGVADHRELDEAKGDADVGLTRAEAIALRDDGANRKTAGVTLLSISGATLVSAMVLFLSADDDGAPRAGLQVGPLGDGVHAGWGGRF